MVAIDLIMHCQMEKSPCKLKYLMERIFSFNWFPNKMTILG